MKISKLLILSLISFSIFASEENYNSLSQSQLNSRLQSALRELHYDWISNLLKAGADVNSINWNQLLLGCQPYTRHFEFNIEQSLKVVDLILSHPKFNIDQTDNEGKTPLLVVANSHIFHTISESGKKLVNQIVEKLLKKGANINFQDKYGATALIYATIQGNKALITLLLKAHPNIHVKLIRAMRPTYTFVKGLNVLDIAKILANAWKTNVRKEIEDILKLEDKKYQDYQIVGLEEDINSLPSDINETGLDVHIYIYINDLNIEGINQLLKDKELNNEQFKTYTKLLENKYEKLKKQAFELQDQGMNGEYNDMNQNIMPRFWQIRDILVSKKEQSNAIKAKAKQLGEHQQLEEEHARNNSLD